MIYSEGKYFVLTDNLPRTDFRYKRNGTYLQPEASEFPMYLRKRKTSTDRNDLRGKICPSCGTTRSMMNKCECNS